ncbi:hypothetical protein VDGL01_04999 [Verticillium dahliae]
MKPIGQTPQTPPSPECECDSDCDCGCDSTTTHSSHLPVQQASPDAFQFARLMACQEDDARGRDDQTMGPSVDTHGTLLLNLSAAAFLPIATWLAFVSPTSLVAPWSDDPAPRRIHGRSQQGSVTLTSFSVNS